MVTSTRWKPLSIFVLTLTIGLSLCVRLIPVFLSDFPLNDGGLFLVMMEDLQRSRFALPLHVSYNSADIPFAYPPLSLYVVAFLSELTRWSLLGVLRFLPAIISVLTIPAFYLFSRLVLKTGVQSALAVFAFAMLPRSFGLQIMGGGLTRSPGFLLALLTLHQAYLLYTRRQRQFVLTTTLFASLTVLSHPEAAWFAVYSVGLLLLFFGRNRQGIYHSLMVAAGTLALTSPWWMTVISRHGLSPLLSAAQTGENSWAFWTPFLTLRFSEEPFGGLLAAVALLGLLVCLAERRFLLPIWMLVMFVLEPRSAATYATVPLALLIAIGITRVVLPTARKPDDIRRPTALRAGPVQENDRTWLMYHLEGVLPKAVLSYLLIYALFSAWVTAQLVASTSLSGEERKAMQWMAANTPETSKVLVITAADYWWRDSTSEWFPALARRVSLGTVHGYEWFPNFSQRGERYQELQGCATQDVDCLENWAQKAKVTFTHVFISRLGKGLQSERCCSALMNSLSSSPGYDLVYTQPETVIFSKRSVEDPG